METTACREATEGGKPLNIAIFALNLQGCAMRCKGHANALGAAQAASCGARWPCNNELYEDQLPHSMLVCVGNAAQDLGPTRT